VETLILAGLQCIRLPERTHTVRLADMLFYKCTGCYTLERMILEMWSCVPMSARDLFVWVFVVGGAITGKAGI